MEYLQLKPGKEPPDISHKRPFKAVLMVEDSVTTEYQNTISGWLVDSGCLYMMAWGLDCSSWDDSVDWANINACTGKEIPDENFVMTTWHEKESVGEVFWFSKNCADHPDVDIKNTLLIHICAENKEIEFTEKYKNA